MYAKKMKKWGIVIFATLAIVISLSLFLVNANAAGTSNESSEVSALTAQVPITTMSTPAADYTVDVATGVSTPPGGTTMIGTTIRLTQPDVVYELVGSTTGYNVNVPVDCTVVLNNCSIVLGNTVGLGVDAGKQVLIYLPENTISTITAKTSIEAFYATNGMVTIDGSGTLNSNGTIGGGQNSSPSGNITIQGSVTINASSTDPNAPAIGGFINAGFFDLVITGNSKINATSTGSNSPAIGIPRGYGTDGVDGITISGNAVVKATATGEYAAGIGGGPMAQVYNVTITDDADVEAYGGPSAAGIGTSNQNHLSLDHLYIGGNAKVQAFGGDETASIATGRFGGPGIGDLSEGIGNTTIEGSATVVSQGGKGGPGMRIRALTVSGGSVLAQGGDSDASVPGISGLIGGEIDYTGGALVSLDGAGTSGTVDNLAIFRPTKVYTDSAHTNLTYQNLLTFKNLQGTTEILSVETSDAKSNPLAGTSTISHNNTQITSMWLPETTEPECILIETTGGQHYLSPYYQLKGYANAVTISNNQILSPTYALTLDNSVAGGTATMTPLATMFKQYVPVDETISVTASPQAGYSFKEWTLTGITSPDNPNYNPVTGGEVAE